jgi:hypothetical protein
MFDWRKSFFTAVMMIAYHDFIFFSRKKSANALRMIEPILSGGLTTINKLLRFSKRRWLMDVFDEDIVHNFWR